ncbi:MAG TPA: cytochrome c3 family protein [Ramlibacter sp.]|nr:cytochrome c3 family protein [Ramlibacter sp.]
MPLRLRSALGTAVAVAAAAVLLSGCEQLVYKDKAMFNPPPDSVSGFLGYATVSTQQTACGTCHSGKQTEWAGTKHSHAWADLQASGHASASCEPCHTTNEHGNSITVAAGFDAVPDSAYHDVQCEACHGPGADHIKAAESVKPLASIATDTGLTNGCGECHSGSHDPFVEEWSASPHGYANAFPDESNRDPCQNCHEGRRAMATALAGLDPRPSGLNVTLGTYLEANDPSAMQPITCAVCHDPHDATNAGQLRAPVGTTDTTELCYRCHHRETEPEQGASPRRGPHGAQGAIVLDEEVGWEPPNWPYTSRILPTHSTNERGCAACHVTPFSAKDASGTTHYYMGHSFAAIPCVNQDTGMPIS